MGLLDGILLQLRKPNLSFLPDSPPINFLKLLMLVLLGSSDIASLAEVVVLALLAVVPDVFDGLD